MEQLISIKTTILAAFGVIGGFIVSQLGGWDLALQALIALMVVDFVTGLMVAGIFKNSNKTASGALESRAGWKGACKKISTIMVVFVAIKIGELVGTETIRYAAILFYAGSEAISLTENLGLMGVKLPPKLISALEVLTENNMLSVVLSDEEAGNESN